MRCGHDLRDRRGVARLRRDHQLLPRPSSIAHVAHSPRPRGGLLLHPQESAGPRKDSPPELNPSRPALPLVVAPPSGLTKENTMLDVGTAAPVLSLEDSDGHPVRLADFIGTSAVLIYFMRTTTCPVCNRHVRDIAGRADELAARGVTVLVAVPEGRA